MSINEQLLLWKKLLRRCAEYYDCRLCDPNQTDSRVRYNSSLALWFPGGDEFDGFTRPVFKDSSRAHYCGTKAFTNGAAGYDADIIAKLPREDLARGVAWIASNFVFKALNRPRSRDAIRRNCERLCALYLAGYYPKIGPQDRQACAVLADDLEECGDPLSDLLRY